MSRINILIGDNDEFYIDGLCKYLLEAYSDRLNIIAFTDKSLLQDYIKDNQAKLDILLLSNEILWEDLKSNNIVILTDSKNKTNDNFTIFKYQSADSIASQIFEAFSILSDREVDIKSGNQECTVIAVYSPVGGIGKSTVAAALCKSLSIKNNNTFYLNLEAAPTTLEFFDACSVSNFSNVLYGIKEKSKNLTLKLDSAISVDSASGVAFFAPGESPLELEEMLPEEIIFLIDQLRTLGKYDYVVIDMSSTLNNANIEILKESNVIITISGKGSIPQSKIKALYQVIEIINKRENIALSEKNILLINKNKGDNIGQQPEGIANDVISLPDLGGVESNVITNTLAGYMDTLVSKLNLREKVNEQG